MKRYTLLLLFVLCAGVSAQVPLGVKVEIAQAEDARRYDQVLENIMRSANPDVRARTALAAGRIGDDKAIPALVGLLEKDRVPEVRVTAAFAIGEIESIKGADAILRAIGETARAQVPGAREPENGNRARLVEAAGKIAAANANDPKAKDLAQAIMFTLHAELLKTTGYDKPTVLQALTAALRARPAGADATVQKFLAFTDPDIVATALNTLARLRAKNANRDARDLLATHVNAIVRANAARLLGAAEDKDAADILLKAATTDSDSRVRVSAIRSLAALRDERAARPLEDLQTTRLKQVIKRDGKALETTANFPRPPEMNEMTEITVALGNILSGKKDATSPDKNRDSTVYETAPPRLQQMILNTPEVSIARARIDPAFFLLGLRDRITATPSPIFKDWRRASAIAQALGAIAGFTKERYGDGLAKDQTEAKELLRLMITDKRLPPMAVPNVLTAYAAFKPTDVSEVLRGYLDNNEVQIRATAAGILEDLPSSVENIDALNAAFNYAWENDVQSNDAILATMDALFKLDKQNARASITAFMLASASPDHLVRAKAFALLRDDAYKAKPELQAFLNSESAKKLSVVGRYGGNGTKNGQILNRDIDYRRALSRKNGSVKAVLTTEKGTFTIDFYPEEAPLTVDNFIKLARSGYFNGLEVHRVVPNFVMQDGDPRGDGNGGPGWSIRCEVNMLPYERGMVGMALSGKDTGGSQWFVTHSPQPHLDGGYTIFGRVNEKDMKVVDNIVRGDKILTVKIVGR